MLPRHSLVWLKDDATWQALTTDAGPRLRDWLRAGHPAVVARRDGSEPAGQLRLGVPLPPAEAKLRLSLSTALTQLQRHSPPPLLDAAIAAAPPHRHAALQALRDGARAAAAMPRVFGSFAWQALTGLAYVQDSSDLDLLWPVDGYAQADAIAVLLHAWEQRQGLRADGELLLPGGQAVNWREYAGDARQLLVKSHAGCALLPRTALFAARSAA